MRIPLLGEHLQVHAHEVQVGDLLADGDDLRRITAVHQGNGKVIARSRSWQRIMNSDIIVTVFR